MVCGDNGEGGGFCALSNHNHNDSRTKGAADNGQCTTPAHHLRRTLSDDSTRQDRR